MTEREILLKKIQELQKELEKCSTPKSARRTRTKSPRSRNYVVDYSSLVQVTNGYVHPEILQLYKEKNYGTKN